MIATEKENIGIKPKSKLKLTTKTSVFNPSLQTRKTREILPHFNSLIDSLLSGLLVPQSHQPLKITKELLQEKMEAKEKKGLGKRKLDLKSALFSFESVDNQNTGTSDSDQNIIKSSLQQDESIQESTKIESTIQDIQQMTPPPQIEPTEEKVPIKEVQIEVTVWMTRAQFAEAVKNLSKTLKDKQIEAIKEFKDREIITEILPESEPKRNGYSNSLLKKVSQAQ